MQIPMIPTDNLYKFAALSGVAILLGCFYMAATNTLRREEAWDDHYIEYLKLDSVCDSFEKQVLGMKALLQENGKSLDRIDLIQIQERSNELSAKLVEFRQIVVASEIEHKRLKLVESRDKRSLWLCGLGMLLGAAVAMLGFFLWYVRLQRPLDAQLNRNGEAT